MLKEEWKDVRDTGFKVSSDGNIMKPNGEIIKFRSKEYRVCDVGYVHRLVAYYFCNPPEGTSDNGVCFGYEIHHKNGIKWDNRASNLVYLTIKEHKEAHRNMTKQKDVAENNNDLIMNYLNSLRG